MALEPEWFGPAHQCPTLRDAKAVVNCHHPRTGKIVAKAGWRLAGSIETRALQLQGWTQTSITLLKTKITEHPTRPFYAAEVHLSWKCRRRTDHRTGVGRRDIANRIFGNPPAERDTAGKAPSSRHDQIPVRRGECEATFPVSQSQTNRLSIRRCPENRLVAPLSRETTPRADREKTSG